MIPLVLVLVLLTVMMLMMNFSLGIFVGLTPLASGVAKRGGNRDYHFALWQHEWKTWERRKGAQRA